MGSGAVVLGASGFAGAEILRILEHHPQIEVLAASASSQIGRAVTHAYPQLSSYGDMTFASTSEALSVDPDVVFSSLPFGESMGLFGGGSEGRVVDVSGDFRLKEASLYAQWYGQAHSFPEALSGWAYGLTEQNRPAISLAEKVANPGCYPTAALLALGPLVKAGALQAGDLVISAVSGISGAGRAGGENFDFSSANENARAYSVVGHKHIPEIEQQLEVLRPADGWSLTFVPHLIPMTRGVLTTCFAEVAGGFSEQDLNEILHGAYDDESFVTVTDSPQTRRLAGTNNAEVGVRLDERTSKVVAIGAIDNLGKGAAGQAVQNANLMLGIEETLGLTTSGMYP